MSIDELVSKLIYLLHDRYKLETEVISSKISNSKYIKVNGEIMIRVSDHYSHHDARTKFNIGNHISKFQRLKNSFYYKDTHYISMVRKLLKELNYGKVKKH